MASRWSRLHGQRSRVRRKGPESGSQEGVTNDDDCSNIRRIGLITTSSSSDWNSVYTTDNAVVLCTWLFRQLLRVLPRRSDKVRTAKFIVQLQAFFKLSFEQFESDDVSFKDINEDFQWDAAAEQQLDKDEERREMGNHSTRMGAAAATAASITVATAETLVRRAAGAAAAAFGLTDYSGMGLVVDENMPPTIFNITRLLLTSSVHPNSMFKVLWDFMYLPINMWICLVTPVLVVFVADLRLPHAFGCIEFTVDLMCVLDVVVHLRTAYISGKFTATTSRRRIARQYFLGGWGLLDTASCFPFLTLINIAHANDYSVRVLLFRLLRLTKLLRLPNVLQTSNVQTYLKAKVFQQKGLITLITLLGAVLVTIHHAACYFYFIGVVATNNRMVAVSELVDAGTGEVVPQSWVEAEQLSFLHNFGRYIVALYWAMYTFLTVGYGDIAIVNAAEKMWAIITAITGVIMAGWFMGAVGAYMGGAGGREADMLQKRQDVFQFIQKRRLRGRLASRLQRYEDGLMWRQLTDSDREIINGLPRMLRAEVVLHLYDKVVQRVLFMQTRPPQFIVELLLRLRLQLYEKGDVVVQEGEIGHEIYFLTDGEMEVRRDWSDEEKDENCGLDPIAMSFRDPTTNSRFRTFLRSITRRGRHSSNSPPLTNTLVTSMSAGQAATGAIPSFSVRVFSGPEELPRASERPRTAAASAGAAAPTAAAAVEAPPISPAVMPSARHSQTVLNSPHVSPGVYDCGTSGSSLLTRLVNGVHLQQQRRGAARTAAAAGGGKRAVKYKSLGYIKAGGLFGHVSCMTGEVRRNSVVAATRSEVLVLSKEDAEELGKDWPDIYNDPGEKRGLIRRRSACLNETLPDAVDFFVPHPGGPVPRWSCPAGKAPASAEPGLGISLATKSRMQAGARSRCMPSVSLGTVSERQVMRQLESQGPLRHSAGEPGQLSQERNDGVGDRCEMKREFDAVMHSCFTRVSALELKSAAEATDTSECMDMGAEETSIPMRRCEVVQPQQQKQQQAQQCVTDVRGKGNVEEANKGPLGDSKSTRASTVAAKTVDISRVAQHCDATSSNAHGSGTPLQVGDQDTSSKGADDYRNEKNGKGERSRADAATAAVEMVAQSPGHT